MSCSTLIPIASANFDNVAFLGLTLLLSNLASADCFIPALAANSA